MPVRFTEGDKRDEQPLSGPIVCPEAFESGSGDHFYVKIRKVIYSKPNHQLRTYKYCRKDYSKVEPIDTNKHRLERKDHV